MSLPPTGCPWFVVADESSRWWSASRRFVPKHVTLTRVDNARELLNLIFHRRSDQRCVVLCAIHEGNPSRKWEPTQMMTAVSQLSRWQPRVVQILAGRIATTDLAPWTELGIRCVVGSPDRLPRILDRLPEFCNNRELPLSSA